MKEIIFSDKFVKFNSKNTILIVKNFVKKDECYKIIDKFHAYKKKKVKKVTRIIPGKSKDWHSTDNLNSVSALYKRRRVRNNFTANLWSKRSFGEKKYLNKMEKELSKIYGLKKRNIWNVNDLYFIQGYVCHYPRGGGYIGPHSDVTFNVRNMTAIMLLSEKGKDYYSGGLKVKLNKKYINLDDHMEAGDVVVFNNTKRHKVDCIDPNIKKISFKSPKGRWMMITTVQRNYNIDPRRYSVTNQY